jgi:hypothetical protein
MGEKEGTSDNSDDEFMSSVISLSSSLLTGAGLETTLVTWSPGDVGSGCGAGAGGLEQPPVNALDN